MEISKVLNSLPVNKPDVYNRLYLDAMRRKDKSPSIEEPKKTLRTDVFERLYAKRKQPEVKQCPNRASSNKLESPRKMTTPRLVETPRTISSPRKYDPAATERLARPRKIPEKVEEPLPPTKKCDGKVFDRLYNDAKRLQENKTKVEAAKLYILEERRVREMNMMTKLQNMEPDIKKDAKTELPIVWIKDSVNFMTMTSRGELYDIQKGIGERGINFDIKKEIYIGLTNEEYTKLINIVKTNKKPEDILELEEIQIKKNQKQKLNLDKSFKFPNKLELLNLLKKKQST